MKKLVPFTLFFFFAIQGISQDISFARKVVDTLTSPAYWGRGYTKNGMEKAADYLAMQFKELGIAPINGKSYFQVFNYPVNTFPGQMELTINKKRLIPGKDFIVSPDSRGVHASATLVQRDSNHYVAAEKNIILSLRDKLTWSVRPKANDYTLIEIDRKVLDRTPTFIEADIDNKEIDSFKAANVCGWVKGMLHPDSIIVISAHYDHLGGMGSNTYFPGANDNASGTSLLLGLAQYYARHPQSYSIAFICFAGEEAGLIGSRYFTQHPLFPLKHIRFLMNLDLAGTGDEGVTVVNATEFPLQFAALNEVNNGSRYVTKINPRGKAANSDHYWFSEMGVPAFFMYTMGGIKAYHDVYDQAATLPLNKYKDLFEMLLAFNKKLMK